MSKRQREYVDFAPHLLWQCTQCGSVVADVAQHTMWHDYPGDWDANAEGPSTREIVHVTVVPRAGAVFPAPTIPIAFAVDGGVVEIDTTGTVKHYGQVVVGARCGHSYTAG